ncbi:MAG: hypothetical protein NT036_06600 [Candidatus Omnitrophica bacterium]|nr:hypothetical protein [Candidatus Omnitrophota bacterium]
MVDHSAAVLIYRNALALFCAAGIAVSPATISKEVPIPKPSLMMTVSECQTAAFENTGLWRYLRTGINYLEASGRDVPIHYKHPGGKAYGPLALTPIAIKDVRLHYPLLSGYTLNNVLSDRDLYEKFAASYAELLLKHYFKIDLLNMPKEEVFKALQKGWFLGPTLYKKGRSVIASRQKRAAEYIDSPTIII